MAHVVVDKTKGEAPVHDGQAPLRRGSMVSEHDAKMAQKGTIQQKNYHT